MSLHIFVVLVTLYSLRIDVSLLVLVYCFRFFSFVQADGVLLAWLVRRIIFQLPKIAKLLLFLFLIQRVVHRSLVIVFRVAICRERVLLCASRLGIFLASGASLSVVELDACI